MPTMTLSMKRLEESGATQEEIKSMIDKIGMSVESIEGGIATIEFTPNRMDLMDATGMVRALRLFSGRQKPKENRYILKADPALKINVDKSVSRIMPVIAGIVARNVDLSEGRAEELIAFTEKLSATFGRKRRKMSVGLHDLDAIKGEISYTTERSGSMVPLGATAHSDYQTIIKTHAKGIEFGGILDGKSYPVLKSGKTTIALIPILNSETTKVSAKTRNLFIDITGMSDTAVTQAARMLACSMIDAGADVYPCIVSKGKERITPEMSTRTVNLRRSEVERTLGIEIDEAQIITMANRMGYLAAKYGRSIMISIPQYRADVISGQDIVEDIAISYGYDRITPQPVFSNSIGKPEEANEFAEKLSTLLVGMGFTESMGMYITTEKDEFESMGETFDEPGSVVLANSRSGSILRRTLMPSVLYVLSASAHDPMPQNVFEVGHVFSVHAGRVIEAQAACFAMCGSKADFAAAKSHIVGLIRPLGTADVSFKEASSKSLIKGRQAKVYVNHKEIGMIGEVHPIVLNNFKIEEPVSIAEISISKLMAAL